KPIALKTLPKRPAKGTRVGFIGCTIPVCSAGAAKNAAKALGWKYERQDFTFTPQSYIQAWDRMMQNPPDVIIYQNVFPNSLGASQLARVKQLKIPTVVVSTAEPTLTAALKPPVSGCYVCARQFAQSGRLMAAIVAADSKNPNVLYVRDPVLAA